MTLFLRQKTDHQVSHYFIVCYQGLERPLDRSIVRQQETRLSLRLDNRGHGLQ